MRKLESRGGEYGVGGGGECGDGGGYQGQSRRFINFGLYVKYVPG